MRWQAGRIVSCVRDVRDGARCRRHSACVLEGRCAAAAGAAERSSTIGDVDVWFRPARRAPRWMRCGGPATAMFVPCASAPDIGRCTIASRFIRRTESPLRFTSPWHRRRSSAGGSITRRWRARCAGSAVRPARSVSSMRSPRQCIWPITRAICTRGATLCSWRARCARSTRISALVSTPFCKARNVMVCA